MSETTPPLEPIPVEIRHWRAATIIAKSFPWLAPLVGERHARYLAIWLFAQWGVQWRFADTELLIWRPLNMAGLLFLEKRIIEFYKERA